MKKQSVLVCKEKIALLDTYKTHKFTVRAEGNICSVKLDGT